MEREEARLTEGMADESFHHAGCSPGCCVVLVCVSECFSRRRRDPRPVDHPPHVPMRFVAAAAGFLPFGPATLLADMLGSGAARSCAGSVGLCRGVGRRPRSWNGHGEGRDRPFGG